MISDEGLVKKSDWLNEEIRRSMNEIESWPEWMVRESGLRDTLRKLKRHLADADKVGKA